MTEIDSTTCDAVTARAVTQRIIEDYYQLVDAYYHEIYKEKPDTNELLRLEREKREKWQELENFNHRRWTRPLMP